MNPLHNHAVVTTIEPRFRHHSLIIGRTVVTTTIQAQGAPIVDRATVHDREGRNYAGRAILLKPWKRGERSASARALVIARRVVTG